jgi:hypothetical protein
VGDDSRPAIILRGLLCLVKLFSPRVALRAPTGRNNRGCVGKFGTVPYVPVRAVRDDDAGDARHGSDATPRPARSQEETRTVPLPTSKDSPPEKGQECHRMSGFSHKQSSSPA